MSTPANTAEAAPADRFSFTRQTAVFLWVLAAFELAIVLVFPAVSVVFGVLAVVLIVIVWLKAGIRTRRWLWWNPVAVPLSQAEGAITLSAALFFSVGVLVIGYEAIRYASGDRHVLTGFAFRHMLPGPPSRQPVGTRAVSYSDPAMQQQFKDELAKAGIPFTLEVKDGKEYIVWTPEHNAAVEEVERRIRERPAAEGRNVRFGDPATQQEFKEWLLKRGIAFEIENIRGEEYVVWKEGPQDLVRQFMESRPTTDCPPEAAARAPGKIGKASC